MNILLNAATKAQLDLAIANPSHALLVVGPDGVGKGTIAKYLSAEILALAEEKLSQYPYIRTIAPDDKGTISIDAIRDVQKFLQLKTIGKRPIRRIIIIEHADSLTREAQNAFLKLLEEPPSDTIMMLTAANVRALLPTMLSRLQTLTVRPPEETALREWFVGQDPTSIAQAYFLSGGLPGLMHALLQDDEKHPLLASVSVAKGLLQMSLFERLVAIDPLSKQRINARYVIDALLRITQVSLAQATTKQDAQRIAQWHRIRKTALAAREELEHNASTKLILSNLVLHI